LNGYPSHGVSVAKMMIRGNAISLFIVLWGIGAREAAGMPGCGMIYRDEYTRFTQRPTEEIAHAEPRVRSASRSANFSSFLKLHRKRIDVHECEAGTLR
jgi:hypothetical protein